MLIDTSSESNPTQYRKGNGYFLFLPYSKRDSSQEAAHVRPDLPHLSDYSVRVISSCHTAFIEYFMEWYVAPQAHSIFLVPTLLMPFYEMPFWTPQQHLCSGVLLCLVPGSFWVQLSSWSQRGDMRISTAVAVALERQLATVPWQHHGATGWSQSELLQ